MLISFESHGWFAGNICSALSTRKIISKTFCSFFNFSSEDEHAITMSLFLRKSIFGVLLENTVLYQNTSVNKFDQKSKILSIYYLSVEMFIMLNQTVVKPSF